jgi:taurine dioxygenase
MNAPAYRRIQVEPLAGALGAQVSGVDLANLDDESFDEIRQAFTEHLVLCFHDQTLEPSDQSAFLERLGPLTRHPMVQTFDDDPFVAPVVREADAQGVNFGGVWHIDASFIESPPYCSALYAVEVPEQGGDTIFSNLYLAYESLSPGMRELCDRLILVHSASVAYDADGPKKSMLDQKGMQFTMREDPTREMAHPLVCIHAHSGRKLLWYPGAYAIRIKGMTEDESRPILQYLQGVLSKPEFTCRVRYRPGTLSMWDNRCTQHLAVNDYGGTRRVMHRVQVGGPPPVGPAMPVRGQPAAAGVASE